jgi:hypothetical protein
MINT